MEIVDEGWSASVPDSVIGKIFSFEDGQAVNTPIVSGKRAVVSSSELDSLDSGDPIPLPRRQSRPKKKNKVVEDPDRSRSPVAEEEPVVSSRNVKS